MEGATAEWLSHCNCNSAGLLLPLPWPAKLLLCVVVGCSAAAARAASRAVASLQRYVADERAAARYDLVLARGCDLSPVEPIYYIFLITASLLTSTL